MSNFCSKCGASVTSDTSFCPSCGTPVAPAGIDPAVATPLPVAPPVYAQATPPPPAQQVVQGGSAVKIILMVVGVVAVLGVIAISIVGFGIWKVSRSVHLNSKDGAVTINTPNGSISATSDTPLSNSDLGTSAYPGAVRGEGSMNLKTPQGSMVSAVFTTNDSASQVVDFYKSKLGDNVTTMEAGGSTILTYADNDQKEQKEKIMITVNRDGDKTHITIVHTSKK